MSDKYYTVLCNWGPLISVCPGPSTILSPPLHTQPELCYISLFFFSCQTLPLIFVCAVTSESGGGNLTLTCVLTCRRQCDKDLSLTWSRSINGSWQSGLMTDKETLRNRLVLPAPAVVPDELACLVLREGGVVALKKWSTINCKYVSC